MSQARFDPAELATGTIELTPEEAWDIAGIPVELSKALQESSFINGTALAMRAPGQCVFPGSEVALSRSIHRRQSITDAPKPRILKAKSSNWGPMDRRIVSLETSEICGKTLAGGGVRKHDEHDLPMVDGKLIGIAEIQCRESLSVVVAKLNAGIYELVEDGKGMPGELRVRDVSTGNPDAKGVIFTYDLSNKEERKSEEKKAEIAAPSWWREDQWGKYSEKADMNLPVYYETANQPRKPLMIYGVPDKSGRVHEITSDVDPAWYSRKANEISVLSPSYTIEAGRERLKQSPPSNKLPEEFHREINTLSFDGTEQMLEALWRLDKFYEAQGRIPMFESLEDIPDAVAEMGNITPFEAYTSIQVNKSYLEDMRIASGKEALSSQAIKGALQHGAGMRFEGGLADTHAVFNYWNGKIYLSKMEAVPNFLLKDDARYLRENFIEIHPTVDMKIWSPVVAKQIELGQKAHIPTKTLEQFEKYQRKQESKREERKTPEKQKAESRSVIIGKNDRNIKLPSLPHREIKREGPKRRLR